MPVASTAQVPKVNTIQNTISTTNRQIITTASTVNLLTNLGMLRTRSVGQARVTGKLQPIDIVDVTWQEDTSNVTMVQRAIRLDPSGQARARLQLRYRGQALELDENAPPFTLGRDAANTADDTWIKELYDAAFKQATEDERALALVFLEQHLKTARR